MRALSPVAATTRTIGSWLTSPASEFGGCRSLERLRRGEVSDLPAPAGACHLAQTVAGAVLEALQVHLTNLPAAELAARGAVRTEVATGMPPAANLTDPVVVQLGLTSAVWAGTDRPLTQRWAAAFRCDGWWALHGGIQHDLTGTLRGVVVRGPGNLPLAPTP